MLTIKTPQEIESMRRSGGILAAVLQQLSAAVRPGDTPQDMAALARHELSSLGVSSPFLGIPGPPPYPDVICISVNDAVQHSIPDSRPFQAGDVVNFDFGVTYDGMITDGGITVCIGGQPDADSDRLITGTRLALENAISVVQDGCRTGDISAAIEQTLRQHGLGIVRELTGHGVGHELHEDPDNL
ncbi:MAG TPA: M24 family metallopeptidase [Candidatus Saccharimonadales bacterium]